VAEERDKCLAFVSEVVNIWVTQNPGNLLTRWGTNSFWRRTVLH